MVASIGVGGQADYYLRHCSDYYTGGTEKAGLWFNPANQFLRHSLLDRHRINPEIFKNLDEGISPDGELIGRAPKDPRLSRVNNYDITFSAPKSMSVLWAIGSKEIREVVETIQTEHAPV